MADLLITYVILSGKPSVPCQMLSNFLRSIIGKQVIINRKPCVLCHDLLYRLNFPCMHFYSCLTLGYFCMYFYQPMADLLISYAAIYWQCQSADLTITPTSCVIETYRSYVVCVCHCWIRRFINKMFVSPYVCLVTFTLLYLVSSLNTECSAFHIPDYISSHFTRRIKRQICEFRCLNGQCIYRHQVCAASTPTLPPPTLPVSSCALPLQPANGNYTLDRSSTIYYVLTYSCSPGYQIYPSPNNNVAICHLGKWYPNLSECVRTCAPRISHSVDTYCEHEGIKVDCSKPMIEGTTVRMNCKHLYSQTDSSANPVSVCKEGSWDYAFIECVPECGNVVPKGDVFIIGGNNVKKGTFPWHVGIYKLNKTNQFEQKCGGSIISRKVIISVANCFTSRKNGALYDVQQYAIGAGKYYRNYYDDRDILSQTRTIKEIIIPPRYKGVLANFTGDIAFLTLDKALEITHVVQPVCIDWNNEYEATQLKDNNIGTVVGWGYTKEGQDPSAELQKLSVPFVDFRTCFDTVPESFTRFLTNDKFCAGFTNGSSVCRGDAGGGLVFLWPGNRLYYLRGLVSAGPSKEGKCDSTQYAVYTRVSDYMETLRAVVANTTVGSLHNIKLT